VDKELANIRAAFSNTTGLTPYERRKYSWKMLYINMIGAFAHAAAGLLPLEAIRRGCLRAVA